MRGIPTNVPFRIVYIGDHRSVGMVVIGFDMLGLWTM